MTRHEIVMNFVDSLERERTSMGLTQAQMAEKLEMSLSGYKKLITGETAKIDLYMAYRMHEITGKWIFDLCGDSDTELNQTANLLSQLTPSQLRFVSGIIKFENAFKVSLPAEQINDYVTLFTPTGDLEDGMIWDSVNIEKLNVATYRKRFGTDLHCAIRITSNHLHPAYNVGDILLVSQTPPRDGDTGIFINRETGRAYLRKFHQTNPCVLEPVNGLGQVFRVNSFDKADMDRWIKFGRVLTKIREEIETEH